MGVSQWVLIETAIQMVFEYTQGVYDTGKKEQEKVLAESIFSETQITCITTMQWKRLQVIQNRSSYMGVSQWVLIETAFRLVFEYTQGVYDTG